MKSKEMFIEELVTLLQETYDKKYLVTYNSESDRIFMAHSDEKLKDTFSFSGKGSYECYLQYQDINAILKVLTTSLNNKNEEILALSKNVRNYEVIKNHLIVRVVALTDELDAEKFVYQVYGDIALTLYAYVHSYDESIATFKIPRRVALSWKIDLSEVFDVAFKNTLEQFPPRVYDTDKIDSDPDNYNYQGDEFIEQKYDFSQKMEYIISNPTTVYGATSIFLPGIAKRISDLIGGDYYFVNTSVHESVVVSPKNIDLECFYQLLQDLTEEFLKNSDYQSYEILSRSVFKYVSETDNIELAMPYISAK